MNALARVTLVAVLLAGLAGTAGCSSKAPVAPQTPQGSGNATEPTSTPGDDGSPAIARDEQAVVYFINGSEKLVPVRVSVVTTDREGALEQLLAGLNAEAGAAGLTSSIPVGTRLLGLAIDGGTATVDLSGDFGSGGGTLSMMSRIAQVVFTLTREPDVKRVAFEMNGEAVEALGGEGIIIGKPQTRTDWEEYSPEVLIESPVLGDTIDSPLTVSGTANVFEARFRISVRDAAGSSVIDQAVQATSGTGTRGTFEAEIPFELAGGPTATLVAWYASAKDGAPVEVMRVPVSVK